MNSVCLMLGIWGVRNGIFVDEIVVGSLVCVWDVWVALKWWIWRHGGRIVLRGHVDGGLNRPASQIKRQKRVWKGKGRAVFGRVWFRWLQPTRPVVGKTRRIYSPVYVNGHSQVGQSPEMPKVSSHEYAAALAKPPPFGGNSMSGR
jgi:hypothetical protein